MNLSNWKLIIPAFVLLFACSAEKTKIGNNRPEAGNGMPTSVQGMVVSKENITNQIIITGNLMANEEIQVQPEISGRITDIYFSEGQYVNSGKLLVKLNDADLQAQLKKAEINLELAKQDESRKNQLLVIKAVSQEEYDQAATALKSAQADIELIKAQIDKTEIKAPFNGTVGLRMVSPGTFVSSGQVLTSFQQTNPMKIEFQVPEKYASTISTRSKVKYTVEGLRDTFFANIYAIDPAIDLATRSFRVRGTSPNSQGKLKPGAFANVTLVLENIENAVMVPASALIPEIRGHKILVIENGKVASRLVEIGIRTDRRVLVEKGLIPGDTLITAGLLQLREGTPVVLASNTEL
jgi:membrane fusion protein, multidrug efflux system